MQEDQPLVSIIIPAYNVQNYIQECIKSVINQTYKNIEIVIIDDQGFDNSIEIAIRELQETDKIWKVINNEENLGLSASRNKGVAESTGDYVFFLDSDDYISCDCIEKMIKIAQLHKSDVVFSAHATILENGELYKTFYLKDSDILNAPYLNTYLNRTAPVMAWNKLIRSSFLWKENLFFIPHIIHEDEPWSFKLSLVANKITVCNDVTYFYRQRKGSIMSDRGISYKKIKSIAIGLIDTANTAIVHGIDKDRYFSEWYAIRVIDLIFDFFKHEKYSNDIFEDIKHLYKSIPNTLYKIRQINMFAFLYIFFSSISPKKLVYNLAKCITRSQAAS